LAKNEEDPKLPLKKSGKLMDVELAIMHVIELRRLLESYPSEFQALVALSEGRREGVSRATITLLRKCGFVRKDGSPLPGVAEVIEAAYRPETPDGPCIVDALDVKTEEHAAIMERIEAKREKRAGKGLERLLREFLRLEDDDERGFR
jgi:hypothetical protein